MAIITGYEQLYGPRFLIEANDKFAQDLIPYVSRFEFEDDEAKFDTLKLTIANPGFRFMNDPRFKQGAKFRVRFGYLTDMSEMKSAIIAHAKPHYPEKEMPTIEMVAYSLQTDINKTAHPVNYGRVASSDVARVVAKRYNFDVDIEDSKDIRAQMRVQPANMADIQYLLALAGQLNWDFYIEGTKLHFHHKRYETPSTLEFKYFTDAKGTLLKFDPDVNMTSPPSTGVTSVNPKDGKTDSAGRAVPTKAARQLLSNNRAKLGGVYFQNGPSADPGTAFQHGTPEADPHVVAAHGAAGQQKIDMSAIKATAEVIGTPRVKARMMIRISGVDSLYTGNWRVASSQHTIDATGVYKTTAKLRRDAGASAKSQSSKSGDGSGEGASGFGAPARQALSNNRGRLTGVVFSGGK